MRRSEVKPGERKRETERGGKEKDGAGRMERGRKKAGEERSRRSGREGRKEIQVKKGGARSGLERPHRD